MTNEIILTPYQATVFTAAEAKLRTQGYLGQPLFEDTYVLSKKLAQYIQSSIPQSNGTVSVNATMAYNYVVGISTPNTPSGNPIGVSTAPANGVSAPVPGGSGTSTQNTPFSGTQPDPSIQTVGSSN